MLRCLGQQAGALFPSDYRMAFQAAQTRGFASPSDSALARVSWPQTLPERSRSCSAKLQAHQSPEGSRARQRSRRALGRGPPIESDRRHAVEEWCSPRRGRSFMFVSPLRRSLDWSDVVIAASAAFRNDRQAASARWTASSTLAAGPVVRGRRRVPADRIGIEERRRCPNPQRRPQLSLTLERDDAAARPSADDGR